MNFLQILKKQIFTLVSIAFLLAYGTLCFLKSITPNGLIGVNLSGAEFGGKFTLPNAGYPQESDFSYFSQKGFALVRLPVAWEKVQPQLNQTLDPDQVGHILQSLAWADKYHLKLILDLHNYAAYHKKRLGTPDVPLQAFTDLWDRLSQVCHDKKGLWAYGLMNEPVGVAKGLWPQAAQAAIQAIRQNDKRTTILVPGEFWSHTREWAQTNPAFPLQDPENNLRYEGHVYFDQDVSGNYQKNLTADGAVPQRADKRILPFCDWLHEHHVQGFIGEYGAPGDSPGWLPVLDRALTIFHENNIPSTYWAAGDFWGNYSLSIEPAKGGSDRPQMALLTRYAYQPTEAAWWEMSVYTLAFVVLWSIFAIGYKLLNRSNDARRDLK